MNSTAQTELVIVMPAYNEEGCIEPVVRKWLEVFPSIEVKNGQVVVVNDGSKDNTAAILDKLAQSFPNLRVVHQKNGGHGNALLHAYRAGLDLNPEWVFHVDSDDQFSPGDLKKLWDLRTQSKFITGYRAVRHDALHRLVITKILVLLNFIFFGKFLKDTNVPYRLIRADYLKKILALLPDNIFAPNIFIAVLAAKDGQKLMEIPISHEDRKTGKVSIVKMSLIKACIRSAKELLEFRRCLPEKLKALNEASH